MTGRRLPRSAPHEQGVSARGCSTSSTRSRAPTCTASWSCATARSSRRGGGIPLLIHQPSYSMFNRHVELVGEGESESLLDAVGDLGIGVIVFSPLAQGLLTGRYLSGKVPEGSRATHGQWLNAENITATYLARARALDEIAQQRGQSLAQLALAWVLRDPRVTSALIGASGVAQLEDNVAALAAGPLSDDELAAIEEHAVDGTGR